MIRLVTLDLYNTLCRGEPSSQDRLVEICNERGLECRPAEFLRANVAAEDFYTVENGRLAIHIRTSDEQRRFYRQMWQLLLREARLPHDDAFADHVVDRMRARRGEWVPFDDMAPTLAGLRERGVKIGVISNTPVDATILCDKLGVCGQVDFIVSSCLIGCEKPDRRIFEAALAEAAIPAAEAVHVGDQPRSDALGAKRVGMHALLLDRDDLLAQESYERIPSLAALLPWLDRQGP